MTLPPGEILFSSMNVARGKASNVAIKMSDMYGFADDTVTSGTILLQTLRGKTKRPEGPNLEVFFGGSVLPTSAYGFAATIIGAPSLASDATRGPVFQSSGNSGLQFRGYKLGASYTKMAWVYATGGGSYNNIISATNTTNGTHYFTLEPGRKLMLGHHNTADNLAFNVVDSVALPLNTWVHITGTHDAASGDTRIYRNGVQVAQKAITAYVGNNVGLQIGNYAVTTYPFLGRIDEVRIFNTALSPTLVASWAAL